MLTVFQCITMEGWTAILYWVFIYFIYNIASLMLNGFVVEICCGRRLAEWREGVPLRSSSCRRTPNSFGHAAAFAACASPKDRRCGLDVVCRCCQTLNLLESKYLTDSRPSHRPTTRWDPPGTGSTSCRSSSSVHSSCSTSFLVFSAGKSSPRISLRAERSARNR
jgi:hypothetical protein